VSLGIWWEHGYQKQYTRGIIGNLEERTKDIVWNLVGTLVLKEKKVNVHHLSLPSPKRTRNLWNTLKALFGILWNALMKGIIWNLVGTLISKANKVNVHHLFLP